MNVRGRAGDYAVILINCILNLAEMDHRAYEGRGGDYSISVRSLSRSGVRRIIHKEKNIDAVIA